MTTTLIDSVPDPDGSHDEFSGIVSTGDHLTQTRGAFPGDRIRLLVPMGSDTPAGTTGRVVKVDHGSVYPVVVWLDTWKAPTFGEIEARSGLPICGHEFDYSVDHA